jgi:hypothetical protein
MVTALWEMLISRVEWYWTHDFGEARPIVLATSPRGEARQDEA